MSLVSHVLTRASRKRLALFVTCGLVAATLPFWLHDRTGAAGAAGSTAIAVRGNMTVTVGGVGRIVSAGSIDSFQAPSGSSTSTSSGQSASTASPDAVFARASGHVGRILVRVGQPVHAGQLLAVLDDNGGASTAFEQARLDLAVAVLELHQKRTGDPSTGRPPRREEVAAASSAVLSARARLRRILLPVTRVETATAQAEVSKALADLAVLRQSPVRPLDSAVRAARLAVEAAKMKLRKASASPDTATLAAADAELAKAKADVAALTRPGAAPLPEELAVAQQAVTLAEKRLAAAKAGQDPVEIELAQLDLDKARLDVTLLVRPKQAPPAEEVASALAALESAQQRVNQVRGPRDAAEVAAARADVGRAESELASLLRAPPAVLPEQLASARRTLVAAKVKLAQLVRVSPADVAAARADLRRAESELVVLKARGGPAAPSEIGLARLRLQGAQIRLEGARRAVEALAVWSPRSGSVTSIVTVPGAPVDGTTAVATVADLRHLEVGVDLSEFDIARVRAGLPARVSVDALGGKLVRGRVRTAAATGTSVNGVVTFPVRIALQQTAGLRPGMNVSVRIVVLRRRGVLQVPLDAVTQNQDGDPVVTVVTGSTSLVQPVTLGLSSSTSVEIVEGLKTGDHVLLVGGQGQGQEED